MHRASTIVSLLFHTPWLFSGTFNEIKQLRRESARGLGLSPRWRASHERETKPRGRTEGRERCENEKQLGGPALVLGISFTYRVTQRNSRAEIPQTNNKNNLRAHKTGIHLAVHNEKDQRSRGKNNTVPLSLLRNLARAPWRRVTRGRQKRKEQR